jgi:hypothetical protein
MFDEDLRKAYNVIQGFVSLVIRMSPDISREGFEVRI